MATPAEMLRDIAARQSALKTYVRMFEQLAELQQTAVGIDSRLAYLAGDGARIVLRAKDAERDNPEPLPFVPCCNWCRAWTKEAS